MNEIGPNPKSVQRRVDVKNRQLWYDIIHSHFHFQKFILLLNEIMNIKENEITQPQMIPIFNEI